MTLKDQTPTFYGIIQIQVRLNIKNIKTMHYPLCWLYLMFVVRVSKWITLFKLCAHDTLRA